MAALMQIEKREFLRPWLRFGIDCTLKIVFLPTLAQLFLVVLSIGLLQ